MREECADLLVGVDDDDGDGEVFAQGQDAGGVDVGGLAESFDAADDGGACESGVVGADSRFEAFDPLRIPQCIEFVIVEIFNVVLRNRSDSESL